ncbi:deoxyribodipyrimidine photo-lyase [Polaromonas sp. CG_9.5]|uniref:DASH family cryptochrome n=1 Tax=Polaromonas sp. CG_9.5 TaxID=3071705 RepID=UPI002DFC94E6|nr:deoxyribodipyrimidine photo-lyase [Polaromonas sp. CG_9.5]
MKAVLYWFRSDLRLHDQPALAQAIALATQQGATLLPLYCHAPDALTRWGFERVGPHRRAFVSDTLACLSAQLAARGSRLLQCTGDALVVLPALVKALGGTDKCTVVCEAIAAPEEQAEVAALRAQGLTVQTVWQSSLLHPDDLPFAPADLPAVFTAFRNAVERAQVQPRAPLPVPIALPTMPALPPEHLGSAGLRTPPVAPAQAVCDERSSFPYGVPAFAGGEVAALAHLTQYLARKLPHSYKQTRNGLTGVDYSSKFSPWLATGALSARQVMAHLRQFEADHGANDGSYWLWFELLWRDYFRLLHLQYGRALYRARGLLDQPLTAHNTQGFKRWCGGQTGEPLVDAALRELATTGYLSNRLRQVAASYLVYDLHGDWRAGAAWFEHCLLDYDPYSNQGNWLYIAGRGTDPRGGRRFNPQKQTQDHDADGSYRRLWSAA